MNSLKKAWSSRREVADALVYWSGAGRVFEALAKPEGAIVLMFHSVADSEHAAYIDPPNRINPALFESQMAFLAKHRSVVSLPHMLAALRAGESPPSGTVCITFDDGYLDNLTEAAPILHKYGLPATVFLATGYVERGETQWADRLHTMLEQRTASGLRIPELGIDEADVGAGARRYGVTRKIHAALLTALYDERQRLLGEIERQLAPRTLGPRVTMTWDDARELQSKYPLFSFGGHTREHIDLRTHGGETARAQIEGCAQDIRRELGIESEVFSFPYGRWCAETQAIARDAGWKFAVGAGNDFRIGASSDRFALPRVNAPKTMTELRFRTSGAYPASLRVLGLA